MNKTVGVIGLGNMGGNVARALHRSGYSLVVYNKTQDRLEPFRSMQGVTLSESLDDFSKKLSSRDGSIVWMMIPGGDATNKAVSELSGTLRGGTVVIDASNSIYTDSIENYKKLHRKGIRYLDVGCAGGPDDLLVGVSLMAGGDREAFDMASDVLRVVSGKGTYGYVGASGSGHMAKLIHNGIFYGIFPIYAEGAELLQRLAADEAGFNTKEALRLLAAAPPINGGIMNAISRAYSEGRFSDEPAPMKVSEMVRWELEAAKRKGIGMVLTGAVLSGYTSISDASGRIYSAAKKILTGH